VALICLFSYYVLKNECEILLRFYKNKNVDFFYEYYQLQNDTTKGIIE